MSTATHVLSGWWRRLAEPSLVRRGVGSVTVAFVIVWLVLLGYIYAKNQHALASDPGLLRFGNAVSLSLRPLHADIEATAAISSTDIWQNIRRADDTRFEGRILYELLDGEGRRLYASPALGTQALPSPPHQLADQPVMGRTHRVYESRIDGAGGRSWIFRLAEPRRTAAAFFSWNARFILEYLLLALPFVLLPVWLSVRSGLKPLHQLAEHLALRDPGSLAPVGIAPRHRELKPLVHALDELLRRLHLKVERERTFVQDAAHEIRTPLAVVAAQADVMAHAADDAGRDHAHSLLHAAIARASHLAQQLLVLATMDDSQQAAPRLIDLAQAVRQWLAQAAPAAMARGMELSLDAPDTLAGQVDEPALESIVFNLVDNAVRYGRPGGSIVVSLLDEDNRTILSVRDDGPGIALQDQSRVFERFYRGTGHDVQGSGLGLAIVQQATARMGGHVHLEDGLDGRGAGFVVSLPKGLL